MGIYRMPQLLTIRIYCPKYVLFLLLIKHNSITANRGIKISPCILQLNAPNGDKRSESSQSRLTAAKKFSILTGQRACGPQSSVGGVVKIKITIA